MNLLSSTHTRVVLRVLALATVVILLAVGARFFGVPALYKIGPQFSYVADVLSLDNFYDASSGMFTGETRSVTTFGYNFVDTTRAGVTVRNFFDVRTVDGEKIIAINRDYTINPYTWKHATGQGETQREGYLFAPRHLKKKDSIPYWHVSYDTPLELVFEKEEVVGGLTTYKYSTSFGVDQSKDLTHLPGVPDQYGINLDVSLTVWFEPTSGWLIKYEDSAIAYYYDQETGSRLYPWNKFENTYRRASISKQVAVAKTQKYVILSLEILVPIFSLLVLAVVLFPRGRNRHVLLIAGIGLALVLAGVIFISAYITPKTPPLLIGISRWVPEGNQVYLENIQGFKEALLNAGYQEGVDVEYIERTANGDAGELTLIAQEFLQRNADLVYSLTTTGTAILKDLIPNRPIVFSIVTYPVEVGLIQSLKKSGNNLVGTRNWVPVERQLDVFLEIAPSARKVGFVHREGEVNSAVQFEEMKEATERAGIDLIHIEARTIEELAIALERASTSVDSLYSACDTLVQGEAESLIISFARSLGIPSFSCNVSGPQKGDLIGTVADFYQIGKLAGEKAVLILEGATPTSLTTDTSSRPLIYINKKTADALGVVIPQNLLLQAAVVIE